MYGDACLGAILRESLFPAMDEPHTLNMIPMSHYNMQHSLIRRGLFLVYGAYFLDKPFISFTALLFALGVVPQRLLIAITFIDKVNPTQVLSDYRFFRVEIRSADHQIWQMVPLKEHIRHPLTKMVVDFDGGMAYHTCNGSSCHHSADKRRALYENFVKFVFF